MQDLDDDLDDEDRWAREQIRKGTAGNADPTAVAAARSAVAAAPQQSYGAYSRPGHGFGAPAASAGNVWLPQPDQLLLAGQDVVRTLQQGVAQLQVSLCPHRTDCRHCRPDRAELCLNQSVVRPPALAPKHFIDPGCSPSLWFNCQAHPLHTIGPLYPVQVQTQHANPACTFIIHSYSFGHSVHASSATLMFCHTHIHNKTDSMCCAGISQECREAAAAHQSEPDRQHCCGGHSGGAAAGFW